MLWLTRSAPRLSWCWELEPVDAGRTRLVTRVRSFHAWFSPEVLRVLLADVRNGFTVRDAMLEVKARAEAVAKKRPTRP
jgi:hypothetical protein